MKKLLFIIGSNRQASFNRQLAQVVEEMIAGDVEVDYLDYRKVPFINQDEEFPTPDIIADVREAVINADGLWIFTPEYNGSYPGLLKNLIDWLSRPYKPGAYSEGTAIANKPVAISGVGGRYATLGAREKLYDLLKAVNAKPLDKHVGIIVNPEAWGNNQLIISDDDKQRLKSQADAFISSLQ